MFRKNNNFRPLTTGMKEILMDCHEREILQLEPLEAGSVKFAAKGLIARGLLQLKKFCTASGKTVMALYLTELGKYYLHQYL